jgi:hypothetical protein
VETWAAASIVVGQGVFLLVALRILRAFGAYVDVLLSAQSENLTIRLNMAAQENERAIMHLNRRHDDPQPEELKA